MPYNILLRNFNIADLCCMSVDNEDFNACVYDAYLRIMDQVNKGYAVTVVDQLDGSIIGCFGFSVINSRNVFIWTITSILNCVGVRKKKIFFKCCYFFLYVVIAVLGKNLDGIFAGTSSKMFSDNWASQYKLLLKFGFKPYKDIFFLKL